jgi:hypothetical protein
MIFPALIFVKWLLKQHYAHISYMEFNSIQTNLGSADIQVGVCPEVKYGFLL